MSPNENENLETTLKEIKDSLAPHVVRQVLVKGKDRFCLVILTNFLHEFVIQGIPDEVIEPQKSIMSSHEVVVFPSDENGLKRGNTLQKRRFGNEAEAIQAFDQTLESIQKGDLR